MAAITIRTPEDTPPIVPGDATTGQSEVRKKMSAGDLRNIVRMHHRGSDDEPQLIDITVHPNDGPYPHAHAEDEIIYVLEGELHLGRRVLTAGSSLLIPGNTLYQFRAGPEGLRFLNFRPRADATYITKEELAEARKERSSST